jgi:NitT/TauT family transport system substrate-binding protein
MRLVEGGFRGRAVASAIALAALLAAPFDAGAAEPLKKVKVGIIFLVADAGMFIARDKGYFADQGLDVELSRFTSGSDIVALLATNQLDVGSGGLTPGLLNALRQGLQLEIVSSKSVMLGPDFGSGNLMVRADLLDAGKVKTVADLKGMTITANNVQSPTLNYIMRALALGGLDGKTDAKIIEMAPDQLVAAFKNKAIEAAYMQAPLSDTIEKKLGLARALPEAASVKIANGDTTNMMFYSPGFTKSEAAKGFMVAHLKAMREYYRIIVQRQGGKTEICDILNKYLKNVPHDCEGVTMSGVDPDGALNLASLERYQAEWLKWGVMREAVDIGKYVDTGFLAYATRQLGAMQ